MTAVPAASRGWRRGCRAAGATRQARDLSAVGRRLLQRPRRPRPAVSRRDLCAGPRPSAAPRTARRPSTYTCSCAAATGTSPPTAPSAAGGSLPKTPAGRSSVATSTSTGHDGHARLWRAVLGAYSAPTSSCPGVNGPAGVTEHALHRRAVLGEAVPIFASERLRTGARDARLGRTASALPLWSSTTANR
jgi:hypothetical protein